MKKIYILLMILASQSCKKETMRPSVSGQVLNDNESFSSFNPTIFIQPEGATVNPAVCVFESTYRIYGSMLVSAPILKVVTLKPKSLP